MVDDRRKNSRISERIVAELHLPDSVITKVGCITDLSLEGISFETEAEFDKNTTLFLTFNLPIQVRGEIVHVNKNKSMKKYGVRFTEIGDVEKRRLEKHIIMKFKK